MPPYTITTLLIVTLTVSTSQETPTAKVDDHGCTATQSLNHQTSSKNVAKDWHPNMKQNVWEGSGQFEGDILVSPRSEVSVRNFQPGVHLLWPDGVVPYVIEYEFNAKQRSIIEGAMDEIQQVCPCVHFRPYNQDDEDFIVIKEHGRGYNSFIGRQGGMQVVSLSIRHRCVFHGVVIHELMHVLGFYHQQNNPNRDEYVSIFWDNIKQDQKYNFCINNATTVSHTADGVKVPYDYSSIMHYGNNAFSINNKSTILPLKDGAYFQNEHLSEWDVWKLNRMYCEFGWADN